MSRRAEVLLEFQNYIEASPVKTETLYQRAASNDDITIKSWLQTWIGNVRSNHKRFGSFKDNGIGKLFGIYRNQPAIVAGSGPSLKVNGHLLKDRAGVPLLSCLHNFHYFEDRNIDVDFYVTLDAGPIVIEEVCEGGSHEPDWYWERTKDKTLLAFIGTDPRLFEKWKGKVYFFNCPVPNDEYKKAINEIEPFHTYISNGGNVLGACLYAAKGIFGGNPIVFVGADFSFSYDKKFHAWDSKYDANLGHVMRTHDIYGNKVLTWQSYANFKSWFDFIVQRVPGQWINCTEGGTFGAYPEGNLMALKQMTLADYIDMQSMSEKIKDQCLNPEKLQELILF